MKSVFFLCILSLCAVPGCSDNSVAPLRAPGFDQPVATGIYVTTIDPTVIATWGNPSSSLTPMGSPSFTFGTPGGDGKRFLYKLSNPSDTVVIVDPVPLHTELFLPYPNPCPGAAAITFEIPRAATVNLWIVRARWVGDPPEDVSNVGGGTVITPQVAAVANLILNRTLAAGIYRSIWSGQTDDGKYVPPGFYRVYLKVEGDLMWADIFLYREMVDLPPDLRKYAQ